MASNSKPKSSKVSILPKPPESPENSSETPVAANFRAEVEAAKAKIRESDKEPVETPKNKGGRPSKAELAARAEAERAKAAAELEQTMPVEALKPIVSLPFAMIAAQTGCEELLLKDEEAEAIVPSLHEVLKTYAPHVKGEHMALTSLGLAVVSISLSKYMTYQNWKRAQAASTEQKNPPQDSRPVEPAQTQQVPNQAFPTDLIKALS